MTFFWAAQLMETRDEQVRWANFYDCMHGSLERYYEPKMPHGIEICTARNAGDPQADYRTALAIMQKDHQTRWPIHNRRVNLFKEEIKEDQSFDQLHIHLYGLGKDANLDGLTGRDWLLFLLIQSCKDPILKKKIFDLDDDEVMLHKVLALARKYEKAERACAEEESISSIFVKKESKRGGKATLSQPVQQPQSTQPSTNGNAKANSNGAKRPCNRCGKESTYEHRQNCPAKADTRTNCKKKGHRAIIWQNGKRLNATGQAASATAPDRAAWTSAAFEQFQEFKRAKELQQQRHQQQQQQQAEECAQIALEFDRRDISNTCNAITEVIACNNVNACNPTPPLFLHLKPVGKPIFRVKVLDDIGAMRSLISLSTANKHGCEIRETNVRLSAANGTNFDVAGTMSLQVVEKGQLVHTIVTII
jgi:hypothetical protein